MAGASYSIKKNRLEKGYYPGFRLEDNGVLISICEDGVHQVYLKAIDSAQRDSSWGRFWFHGVFAENMVFYVYAAAMNEEVFNRNGQKVQIEEFLCSGQETSLIKKEFMRQAGAVRAVNQSDILLYQLKGRYLYLMIEVIGKGDCRISDIQVDVQGDNFMNTFPEIYRETNGFFHRFLSVFSSIYNDFETDILNLPQMLDIDTCPGKLLPAYAGWLGIDVGDDFLEEKILRQLVKEAYQLNRIKGTKAALKRVAEIVLSEEVLVLERNAMEDFVDMKQREDFGRMYGNTMYEVTILVKNIISEVQRSQLLFLLNQFKPVRARLHIILLKKTGVLDSYSYLDMNAGIPGQETGRLDEQKELDNMIRME